MSVFEEIITLQLGTFANFVGTHWWNIQRNSFIYDREVADTDSTRLNHDTLFREGRNYKGQTTFTPRLVAVEEKDLLDSLDFVDPLYSSTSSASAAIDGSLTTWSGHEVLVKQQKRSRNRFLEDTRNDEKEQCATDLPPEKRLYSLESDVVSWTDYQKAFYHPKSVLAIPSLKTAGRPVSSHASLFNLPGGGREICEDLFERVRWFAENSESVQGFHLLLDWYSGFSAFCAPLLENLKEEFGKKSCVCFPVMPTSLGFNDVADYNEYLLNCASSLLALTEPTSLSILSTPFSLAVKPFGRTGTDSAVSLDYVHYNASLAYHSGAILAAALETITTPWRIKREADRLSDICHSLPGEKLASAAVGLPFHFPRSTLSSKNAALGTQETFGSQLARLRRAQQTDVPMHSLTPHCSASLPNVRDQTTDSVYRFTLRGTTSLAPLANSPQFLTELSEASAFEQHLACYDSHALQLCEFYQDKVARFSICEARLPVSTLAPFPNIFDSCVTPQGQVISSGSHYARPSQSIVEGVPVFSRVNLSSNNACRSLVTALQSEFKKVPPESLRGIERDFYTELNEGLLNVVE